MSFKQTTIELYNSLDSEGDFIRVIEFSCRNIIKYGILSYSTIPEIIIIVYELVINRHLIFKDNSELAELLEYIVFQFCIKQKINLDSHPELLDVINVSIKALLYVPSHFKLNFNNCWFCFK
jgi:hypothetical protein